MDNFNSTYSNSLGNQVQLHNKTNKAHNNPQPNTTTAELANTFNLQNNTPTKTHKSTKSLRKDKIIQFKYNNDNNWNIVTLVKKCGKCTGIYSHAWNVKFQDDTIKSVDFIQKQ